MPFVLHLRWAHQGLNKHPGQLAKQAEYNGGRMGTEQMSLPDDSRSLRPPSMDLFASSQNHQLEHSFTRFFHPQAEGTDASMTPWPQGLFYAFRLILLLPRLLRWIKDLKVKILVVAPFWPRLIHLDYSQQVIDTIQASRRTSTTRIYNAIWEVFVRWCTRKQVSTLKPKIKDVLFFLQDGALFGIKAPTFRRHLSVLASVLPSFRGLPITKHPHVARFLHGVTLKNSTQIHRFPTWKLHTVLTALTKAPFEPAHRIPLRFLRMKVVFLIAITLARRIESSVRQGRSLWIPQRQGGLAHRFNIYPESELQIPQGIGDIFTIFLSQSFLPKGKDLAHTGCEIDTEVLHP